MATTATTEPDRPAILDAFVACVNACEPDHPYRTDPYPITTDDIKYSYCRASGRYYAKCGPRSYPHVAYFAPDTAYCQRIRTEKFLALLVHELTHIAEGSHTEGSIHNWAFWREYTFYAMELLDGLDRIREVVGPVDEVALREELVNDPNPSIIDKRSMTVEEVKSFIDKYVGDTRTVVR